MLRGQNVVIAAALSPPGGNRQVGGEIGPLKFLKRQMDDRAKLDPLRARVLHANSVLHRHTKCVTANPDISTASLRRAQAERGRGLSRKD